MLLCVLRNEIEVFCCCSGVRPGFAWHVCDRRRIFPISSHSIIIEYGDGCYHFAMRFVWADLYRSNTSGNFQKNIESLLQLYDDKTTIQSRTR